ncbi:MAG TPA: acyl-CoA thioesterase [Bacteroidales bacterium]|nr:acyl-CoA thioesterase [Bacteroidales bacterium]HPR57521.1 acyl-CoA thioesterase [Bacteroidales bacterium]HRW97555.1 acyl-CoA thioesterase [Bacteroidales bacterium]
MQLISTKICKTSDIGIHNNLFGGTMLSWMDEAGGTMAAELACSPNMITLKIHEVLFKRPVKVSDHIRIYGQLLTVGNSSLTLAVIAKKFYFETQKEETVCSTRMMFVNIDENGQSKPVNKTVRENLIKTLNNNNIDNL